MIETLKTNIKTVIIFAIALSISIVLIIFGFRLSSLKKENEKLKDDVDEKSQKIESLSKEVSRLETVIKEMNKQKEIEDNLIEEEQKKELEINAHRNEFYKEIDKLQYENDGVKTWCEEPIPSDVSTLFILGLQ